MSKVLNRYTGEVIIEYEDLLHTGDLEGVDLTVADLRGVNLEGVDLTGADLTEALIDKNTKLPQEWLEECKEQALMIMRSPALNGEVAFLKEALLEGQVDGNQYEGECACLVGTLANARGADVEVFCSSISYQRSSIKPAEQFYLMIKEGDTPDNSIPAKIALSWCEEVLQEKTTPGS